MKLQKVFDTSNANTLMQSYVDHNQANVTPLEETNKTSVTNPEDTVIYDLCDKEFKLTILN